MRKRRRFWEWVKYRVDTDLAKGMIALIRLLFIVTVIVVIAIGLGAYITGGAEGQGLPASIWKSFVHTLTPGALISDKGTVLYVLLMTLSTLFGLIVTSTLIGIITTAIRGRLEHLRHGKSKIIETGHVVVLGSAGSIDTILNELYETNKNRRNETVVVMDDVEDIGFFDDIIKPRFFNDPVTTLVCRCGDLTEYDSLSICSVETAKCIIVNTGDDFQTIKVLLAVTEYIKQFSNDRVYCVAVINDMDNIEAAQIASAGRAEILYVKSTMSKIIAHTCRHAGLSQVYIEIFDFDGDEFYFESVPALTGKKMSDLNLYFPKSVVIGIVRNGVSLLAPDRNLVLESGDELILFAEDRGVSKPKAQPAPVKHTVIAPEMTRTVAPSRKLLIFGHNNKLTEILMEEDKYLSRESKVVIAVEDKGDGSEKVLRQKLRHLPLQNISIDFRCLDIYQKETLQTLLETGPSSILILTEDVNTEERENEVDAKNLILLLKLHSLLEKTPRQLSVTCEMYREHNQNLAEIIAEDDFIVSRKIISLMVTQISQNRALYDVFEELLSSEGVEIHMRYPGDYVKLGVPIDMYTVGIATENRGEICIGYRKYHKETGGIEIITNPWKGDEVVFSENDRLIVIAPENDLAAFHPQ